MNRAKYLAIEGSGERPGWRLLRPVILSPELRIAEDDVDRIAPRKGDHIWTHVHVVLDGVGEFRSLGDEFVCATDEGRRSHVGAFHHHDFANDNLR